MRTFRLRRSGDDFLMQASIGGNWKALYRFDLQPQFQADYEVSNWYLSNHPEFAICHRADGCPAGPGSQVCVERLRICGASFERRDGTTYLTNAIELRDDP